jgi:hypothetical protein
MLIDSLSRYISHMRCPAQHRARARTCSEAIIFIYDAVYRLIYQKFPDSLESRRVKYKRNGYNDIQGMEDAQTTITGNKIGKVCAFIIILIVDFRMGFR